MLRVGLVYHGHGRDNRNETVYLDELAEHYWLVGTVRERTRGRNQLVAAFAKRSKPAPTTCQTSTNK
jgi:hypothetical protein